jgi:hypothetical protein
LASELDLVKERDERMLAILNVNSQAGSTCDMKVEIALTATVEGVCIAISTASITNFFLSLHKNGVVWVERVLYLGRQLEARFME